MVYKDSNNKKIYSNVTLCHLDGTKEKVFDCGENDLGFKANNNNYVFDYAEQFFPLSEFNLKEWTIVEQRKEESK